MSKKILIIEDDKILSNALSIALSDVGFSVITAFDGDEGLLKAENDVPDLILLDLVLPQKSGEEVLKKIRTKNDNVPVIISTVKEDPETIARCLDAGASGYFTKSTYSLDDIVKKIKEMLNIKD